MTISIASFYFNLNFEIEKICHFSFYPKIDEMNQKIILFCPCPIQSKMIGPGIRYFEFAKQLSKNFSLTLTTPQKSSDFDHSSFTFSIIQYDQTNVISLVKEHDIIILQGFLLEIYPKILQFKKYLVVDLYSPFHLENLAIGHSKKHQQHLEDILCFNHYFAYADHFLCASEKQRDFYLGALSTFNRITPKNYQTILENVISVVPFGFPELPPVVKEGVLRNQKYGITQNDFVMIWGGGVWDWFDPLTPIRAVAKLVEQGNLVKLFFMGTVSPVDGLPDNHMLFQAKQLAKDLGVFNKHVIFNEDWVPYQERGAYLLESNVGVSSHFDHLETRFAFRTRILDYLWASLPMIVTQGDEFANLIEQKKLGYITNFESVEDWVHAIEQLQNKQNYHQTKTNISQMRESFTWENVIQPLKNFCSNPQKTAHQQHEEVLMPMLLTKFPIIKKIYHWFYLRRGHSLLEYLNDFCFAIKKRIFKICGKDIA